MILQSMAMKRHMSLTYHLMCGAAMYHSMMCQKDPHMIHICHCCHPMSPGNQRRYCGGFLYACAQSGCSCCCNRHAWQPHKHDKGANLMSKAGLLKAFVPAISSCLLTPRVLARTAQRTHDELCMWTKHQHALSAAMLMPDVTRHACKSVAAALCPCLSRRR
jgi:hypothetical protein